MKAALYIRVSTDNQVDRDSLKTQEERLRQYCSLKNYQVFNVYKEEGVSAKDTNRPAFEAMIKDVELKKFNCVLITRLDRINRSLKDLIGLMEFLNEKEIKLVSLNEDINTDGPMGRFMLNLLGSIAQLEREIDAERVSTDMHHRASKGKWNGGVVPYGYTTREKLTKQFQKQGLTEIQALEKSTKTAPELKKLYLNKEESKVIQYIFDKYLELKSLRGTVHELNVSGRKTRKGHWTTTTVRRVLTNPFYLGYISYGKRKTDIATGKLKNVQKDLLKIVKGEHEPIIIKKQFNDVQEILKEKYFKPTVSPKTYLLTGLLKCGFCDGRMCGSTQPRKVSSGETKSYPYYKCQTPFRKGKSVCKGQTIDGKIIEEIVINSIFNISENKEFLAEKEKLIKLLKKSTKPDKSIEREKARITKQENELISRRNTLLEKLEKKILDDEIFLERYEKIKQELEEVRGRKEELELKAEESDAKILAFEASYEELVNFKETWPLLDDEDKRARLSLIVKDIVVIKEGKKLKLDITLYMDTLDNSGKGSDVLCNGPHLQGFIAATSKNREGNVKDIEDREIVTLPSSRG